jgi:hypothetical protein
MQTQNTKHLLDKINGLHQSISTDEQISSIERDLMLSYIRQLYDTYVSMPVVIEHVTNALPTVIPAAIVAEKVVEKVIEKVIEKPIEVQAEPQLEVQIEKAVVAPIIYLDPTPVVVEEEVLELPIIVSKPEVAAPIVVEPVMPSLSVAPPKFEIGAKPAPLIQPNNLRVDEDELFDQNARKELSDRLGETPIEDIKRSMGINERILTQNELFASDNFEFENAIARLQNMTDFEDAKNYLLQLAQRYDWASKEKFAKPFIKLVRRKFNK